MQIERLENIKVGRTAPQQDHPFPVQPLASSSWEFAISKSLCLCAGGTFRRWKEHHHPSAVPFLRCTGWLHPY